MPPTREVRPSEARTPAVAESTAIEKTPRHVRTWRVIAADSLFTRAMLALSLQQLMLA
jgi:hypothetical protein